MNVNNLLLKIQDGYNLVFDLDNTLFDESTYLFSRYKHICNSIYKSKCESDQAYDYLVSEFRKVGRGRLFNKLLNKFPSKFDMKYLLSVFRDSELNESLNFYPWFYDFLEKAPMEFQVKIITNGNVKQQKNKIKSLLRTVENYEIPFVVIYANESRPKPSTESFLKLSLPKSKVLYIGDSVTDMEFAENLGISFMYPSNV
ncbi:HAD family hydrolase [Vibrio splendidus]|uniref:HAD family hydrolase n=1 Tax=Vibrio splendidus TaxID=29497 RepID=UPI00352DAC93